MGAVKFIYYCKHCNFTVVVVVFAKVQVEGFQVQVSVSFSAYYERRRSLFIL